MLQNEGHTSVDRPLRTLHAKDMSSHLCIRKVIDACNGLTAGFYNTQLTQQDFECSTCKAQPWGHVSLVVVFNSSSENVRC